MHACTCTNLCVIVQNHLYTYTHTHLQSTQPTDAKINEESSDIKTTDQDETTSESAQPSSVSLETSNAGTSLTDETEPAQPRSQVRHLF